MGKFRYRHLLMMPSFYLLATFSVAYLMYLSDVVVYDPAPTLLHIVSLCVIFASSISTLLFYNLYKFEINRLAEADYSCSRKESQIIKAATVLFLLLGLVGIYKYTVDFSRTILEDGIFFILLIKNSGQVRILSDEVNSIGTQLSYLTWFAAFLMAMLIGSKRMSTKWWALIALVLISNLVFVDRTRQVWILFTSILCWFLYGYKEISRKKLLRIVSFLSLCFIAVFVAVGVWLGKVNTEVQYTKGNMPPELQPVFLYTTSPMAYLGQLIATEPKVDYNPQRVFYPAYKLMSAMGLTAKPPSQVLEPFYIPFPVNTGTFLEPYFSDGGIIFLSLGILLHSFGLDLICFALLKRRNYLTIIAHSSLCFVNFTGFFTPKLTNLPTWLFVLPGLVMLLFSRNSGELSLRNQRKCDEALDI